MRDENVIEIINRAYEFVRDFRRYDPVLKTYNEFNFIYKVPSISGIHKKEWGKDINSVKPNTLEYILVYLHDMNYQLLEDSLVAYFYYWKVRKNDNKEMIKRYEKILEYYSHENNQQVDITNISYIAVIYSVSFYIGTIRVCKIGYTTDLYRYVKLIKNIRDKYPLVSVGNFKVHQEIQFYNTTSIDGEIAAKTFEDEALKNLKKYDACIGSKYFFDGYKESYLAS